MKKEPKGEDRKARGRFIDQPGQVRDTTPESTRKRQVKDWKKLEEMMKKKK